MRRKPRGIAQKHALEKRKKKKKGKKGPKTFAQHGRNSRHGYVCLIAPTPYNLSGSTKKSHLSETDHYDSDPVYSGWMEPLNNGNKGLDVKQREIVKITSAKSKNSGWQKNKVKKYN